MKIKKIVDLLKSMNSLEILKLTKKLEKEFKIKGNTEEKKITDVSKKKNKEQKFNLVLEKTGDNRISIIRLVKEITNLGLKESKEMTENLPKTILKGQDGKTANIIKNKFEKLGAILKIS